MTTEELYQSRLKRYVTAMRNGKPDMIPIRPFVAEFASRMLVIPLNKQLMIIAMQ